MTQPIVTAEAVDRLERERPSPAATLDFTIGGTVETEVHSTLAAQRERDIAEGHARLSQASDRFGAAMDRAADPQTVNRNMADLKERAAARRDRQRSMSQAFTQVQGEDV